MRAWLLCLGCGVVAACARPAEPEVPAMVPTGATPAAYGTKFDEALARARQLRDQARSQPAPPYSGDGTKEATLLYTQGELKDWSSRLNRDIDLATAAYKDAFSATADPERLTLVYGEAAELRAWFVQQLTDALIAAMPEAAHSDPAIHGKFLAAIDHATADQRRLAREGATSCAKYDKRARSKNNAALVATCGEILRRFPDPETTAATTPSPAP